MKKILIFYPYIIAYGGIERLIISLCKEISIKGYEPVLLCFEDKINIKKYNKQMTVRLIKSRNIIEKIFNLKKYLRKN